VEFQRAVDQREAVAEYAGKFPNVVADRIQPAALQRALRAERGQYRVAARLQGMGELPQVVRALFRLGQEVEHGAVVPQVVAGLRQRRVEQVGRQPGHRVRRLAQAFTGDVQGRRGNVEHAEVAVAACKQVVDQGRCAAAHIEHGGVALGRGALDQRQ
jgi:hypothetical protein